MRKLYQLQHWSKSDNKWVDDAWVCSAQMISLADIAKELIILKRLGFKEFRLVITRIETVDDLAEIEAAIAAEN